MKVRALVSRYVTMEVDTDDLDKSCNIIRDAVKMDSTDLYWEDPTVDYPSVEERTDYDFSDRDYEEAVERRLEVL